MATENDNGKWQRKIANEHANQRIKQTNNAIGFDFLQN